MHVKFASYVLMTAWKAYVLTMLALISSDFKEINEIFMTIDRNGTNERIDFRKFSVDRMLKLT